MVNLKSIILSQFEQVASERDKTLAPLTDDTLLLESGLDSLCFAIIVAQLEDALGINPFQSETDEGFPMTFGDFVKFYENAAT